ncbi:MAG: DUF4040 domain-containing protein [Rhodobacteraceae bacterium]|nr:DUF4040 domain-containing protein [Paracoccaceae bacterium]
MAVVGWLPVVLSVALFALFVPMLGPVGAGETLRYSWEWAPSLGIDLSFWIDGLSLMFALLITGIGALIHLYSARYLRGHPQFGRFALYLTAFELAMLGLVLADSLITLFVFWELTTITSFLLIGFNHYDPASRRNATQALFVTGAGGMALLAGLIILGAAAGTFELSEIRASMGNLGEHVLYTPIAILFLLAAFTKSAQVPFHFWLPNAMAAPTPVSAYLHSATMVKAGVYLLARMHPNLSGTDLWAWSLTILGGITAVFASIMAVKQTDMKQTLAYTTLMALGTLTLYLASDVPYAITGAMTFLLVHSLYKAALFLIAGIVDHRTGTRDLEILGGLGRTMPLTALAAALAASSMAGFPPFIGFIGKEILYAGGERLAEFQIWTLGAGIAANALMVAVAGIVAFKPFWRPAGGEAMRTPVEAATMMLVGPAILGALSLYFGLFPGGLQNDLIHPAVNAVMGEKVKAAELKLWAGVNVALFLSLATFALGFILYGLHVRLRERLAAMGERAPSFDVGWDALLRGLVFGARRLTRTIQTGVLRDYVRYTFLTLLALLGGALIFNTEPVYVWPKFPVFEIPGLLVCLLIFSGALLATLTSSRITAIAGLGAVGIGVALIFIVFSAPDVAITQLLVETLIVVLFAAAALRLPKLPRLTGSSKVRWGDALVSVAIGSVIAALIIQIVAVPLDLRLTEYFEVTSFPEAFGRNIVNVILVDFRALDTFGEITVVVVAALGAYALLRPTRRKEDDA